MATPPAPEPLEDARRALARGHWAEARERLSTALERVESRLDPEGEGAAELAEQPEWAAEAWDGIGLASYWLDDPEAAVEAHERAYRLHRAAGHAAPAARAAIWLVEHYMTFHGAHAVARGWMERADSLLRDLAPGAEHAWLEVYRGHYALMVDGSPRHARRHAERALEVARRASSVEAEMVALALEGLALVSEGAVEQGMPRLDEASAAAVSRELGDLNAVAWACCYLIHGCESVRDFQRAAEWCERVKAFCERWGLKPVFGACRTHYASVLTWRGEWEAAERELEETMADARGSRPPIVRAGTVRLAELRWRQGAPDEARALLSQASGHPRASLVQAALAQDEGRWEEAAELAARYLRHVPPESRVERVDGLTALALAAGAAGDVETAERARDELEAVAVSVDTPLLWGAAHLARGMAARARSEPERARTDLEDAVVLFERGGAPFEAAQARILLAEVLRGTGRDDSARRELETAEGTLRRLGAAARAELVAGVAAGGGFDESTSGARGGAAGPGGPLTDREREVLQLVAEGLTNADIARRLYLSPHTVKRHVANILTKLEESSRAAAVARATRQGWI